MALTRVAPAGIGSTPGTGYVIGDSFLHATGLNATNAYYTGIVTTQTLRVIGDFQVDGTTTTLDTEVTSVDKLEVAANNNTVGVAITQSGTGDILNLYDSGTEVFSVTDGGKVKIGTTTEGQTQADDLTIATSGHTGMTIRSGTTSKGAIYFSDGTSGSSEYRGYVEYNHQDDFLRFGTAAVEKVRITSGGNVGINEDNPRHRLTVNSGTINVAIAVSSTDAGSYISYQDNTTGDTGTNSEVYAGALGGSFVIHTDAQNAPRVSVTNAGNVGINSTTPRAIVDFGPGTGNGTLNQTVANYQAVFEAPTGTGNYTRNIAFASRTSAISAAINAVDEGGSDATGLIVATGTAGSIAERLRITSSGNIGVNKTTPKEWYSTYKTLQIYDAAYIAGSSDDSFVAIGANNYLDTGGTYDYTNTDYASQLYQVDGQLVFRNAPSGTADTAITWAERFKVTSAGELNLSYGTINLGTADSSSGHINAYELMTFNIDSDNDDSNRHFTWYKNGESGGGTGMMRLDENSRLCIGGDLATSANNLTLKHATGVEIDMNCTSGSGNNFRLKSDSGGIFTIRDHSAGVDRITIRDNGNVGINETDPIGDLSITGANGTSMEFQADITNGTNRITNYNRSTSTYKGFRLDASYLDFFISGSHRFSMGSTGQMEVSNTVSSNDAAVNIYKASGSNSDKAILRVGYNAGAAFEIYRIRNNGDIFMGPNQSGSDLIFQNVPTGGSTTERLRIQENGNIGVGGITPSFTTGGGIHLADAMAIGFANGNNGRPDFQLASVNGTTLDFRCGNGADTADIQMTTDGKLRLGNTIASLAGDDCVKDMIAGRAMVNRFRRGTSNGTRFGTVTGYIGDMLSSDGVQMSNVFYMGQLNSSSSSNATQNMFSYYTSGHWGQYTSMRVWMHTDYYNHGYQVWDVYNGSITSIASRGSGGNLTQSSTTVGSGTHSGQNVTRYNITVENPGTYFQVRWYLGLYFGATMGVYSNAYSESSMDTYLSTRGSGIHFKGLNAAALSSSPMYRTQ